VQPIRGKLFIGQHFIYSLRVIEHYLRVVAEDPLRIEALVEASVATELETRGKRLLAEQTAAQQKAQSNVPDSLDTNASSQPWNTYDQQMLDLILRPLQGYSGVSNGVVAPRASTVFTSVVLSRMMGEQPATLNNYLQRFAKKRVYYYESALTHCPTLEAADIWVKERMSSTPYRVRDFLITTNLASLVRFVTKDSGFFDELNLFYYLFYRWHRIDYSHIRAIEAAGVHLPYRDALIDVLRLLEERRLSFDVHEVVALIDEYFEYYALFISDAQVVNALDYSYHTCYRYNSPAETERMLRDLWAVHRAFYRTGKDMPPANGRLSETQNTTMCHYLNSTQTIWLSEEPRIPDRLPYTIEATWEGSFTNAFANAVERKRRINEALAHLHTLAAQGAIFTLADCDELELLLETANMTPRGTTRFTSNIYYYDAVGAAAKKERFPRFEGLSFSPPYYPLIDSPPHTLLGSDNFTFEADPLHLIPPLEVESFKPLLDDFITDSRLKAMNAGYEGISEFKIYLYDCKRDNENEQASDGVRLTSAATVPGVATAGLTSAATVPGVAGVAAATAAGAATVPGAAGVAAAAADAATGVTNTTNAARLPALHYTFKAGKCDYFTGVARKDLFSRFLVPSVGNLRQPLLYLLEHGTLPDFAPYSEAHETQQLYQKMASDKDSPNVRLSRLFANHPALEVKLTQELKLMIDALYARIVATGHARDEKGNVRILDNGATYTGCGTFVLTGDRDANNNDRPFLLLEKRWRVSEENDNLSYPSGGSCDLYVPDDQVPQEGYEHLKELEASPFVTAARELREELNLICRPDDLFLVSFGVDVNRNLQQFSFVLETTQTARRVLERKRFARTPREGFTFFVPFERRVICDILNNYQMESGAVYSLMRLLELKAHRLWPSEG
jgi:hypothetical protein